MSDLELTKQIKNALVEWSDANRKALEVKEKISSYLRDDGQIYQPSEEEAKCIENADRLWDKVYALILEAHPL